jgi:hypothetical protein
MPILGYLSIRIERMSLCQKKERTDNTLAWQAWQPGSDPEVKSGRLPFYEFLE